MKPIDKRLWDVYKHTERKKSKFPCDHCDGEWVIYNCPQCGAPECCPTCCDEATEELKQQALNLVEGKE